MTLIEEKDRIISALTAVTANQHVELVRQSARITELLQSNNAFEERARKAERRIKKLRDFLDDLPIGYPLTQNGKSIDHTAINDFLKP